LDQPEEPQIAVRFTHKKHAEEPKVWLSLDVEYILPNLGMGSIQKVAAVVEGIFVFRKGTPEEVIAQYYPAVCLANLYGMMRGLIAQSTGCSASGAVYLPIVNMVEVVSEAQPEETTIFSTPQNLPSKSNKAKKSRRHSAKET